MYWGVVVTDVAVAIGLHADGCPKGRREVCSGDPREKEVAAGRSYGQMECGRKGVGYSTLDSYQDKFDCFPNSLRPKEI